MDNTSKFNPQAVLGDKIIELDRKALCELVAALCEQIQKETGGERYRGGVWPGNISLDAEGHTALGAAKTGDWEGQELDFLAPELFWHGESSPAADVYSLGMLLYYAVNSGKLPFAKSGAEKARERRMGGESFPAPKASGRRLGEIISKATAFKAGDRYQSMAELKAVLDSCVKNLYLNGAPSAETIFHKSDDDLSQVERMMVAILERDEKMEPQPVEEEEEAEEDATESEAVAEPEDEPEEAPAEPEGKPAEEPKPEKQPVVLLREEKNPELEPVVVKRPAPAVQYSKSAERERKIAEQVKKRRRRPLLFVLVLCALLVVAAMLYNEVTRDHTQDTVQPTVAPTPPAADQTISPIETPSTVPETEPPEETAAPKQSSYQLFIEDVSWAEAKARCEAKGGHLVVINDADELQKVIDLAEAYGVENIWIGCSRVDGVLTWVTGETVDYYVWDRGEPSYRDGYDGTPEDYVLLWDHNGWVYNDSRNDLMEDYAYIYSGNIAYVCEYEN